LNTGDVWNAQCIVGYLGVNSLFENYVTYKALLRSVDHIFSQNILLEHRFVRFSVFIPGFKHTINTCIYNIDVAYTLKVTYLSCITYITYAYEIKCSLIKLNISF
jgi:hypothetical protein